MPARGMCGFAAEPISRAPQQRSRADLARDLAPISRAHLARLHHDGVAPASFAPGTALGRAFTVLSTNADRRGKRLVSTIEAAGGAPIWGVQWHPERPQFQWGEPAWGPAGDFMDHSALAVDTMHAVAAFFVRQARRSTHAWRSAREEAAALIYNYAPVVSASSYQAYLF